MSARDVGLVAFTGALGFALGMLFAPKPGAELREDLMLWISTKTSGGDESMPDWFGESEEGTEGILPESGGMPMSGGGGSKLAGLKQYYDQRKQQVPGKIPHPKKLFNNE